MSTRQQSSISLLFSLVTVGRLAVPISILILWQFLATIASDFALVPPGAAVNAVIDGFQTGWLITGLQVTIFTLLIAYLLAVLAGIWAGVVLGTNELLQDILEPLILGTYAIPKVTLYPLFLFIFALGTDAIIAFGWFHGVFPIAILTMRAMETIDEEYLNVARSLRLSRWQRFRHVIVPAILPGLIIGLRLGFNLTFLGIILGEMFAARAGIGHELINFIGSVQVANILGVILILILIATAVNLLFFYIEQRLSVRSSDQVSMRM